MKKEVNLHLLSKEELIAIINKKDDIISKKDEEQRVNEKAHLIEIEKLLNKVHLFACMAFGSKSEKMKKEFKKVLDAIPVKYYELLKDVFIDDVLVIEKEDSKKEERKAKGKHSDDSITKRTPDRVINLEGGSKCPDCDNDSKQIDIDKKTIVEMKQLMEILEYHIPVYKCNKCGKMHRMKIERTLNNTSASTDTISQVIYNKIFGGIPVSRMSSLLQVVSKNTINKWFYKGGVIIEPLAQLIGEQLMNVKAIYADETPMPVLNLKNGEGKAGYLITYTSGRYETPIKVFKYGSGRSRDVLMELPRKNKEKIVLVTDSYRAYQDEENIVNAHCWAHARRKFYDIYKRAPQDQFLKEVLDYISQLYMIEKKIHEDNPDKRVAVRKKKTILILKNIHTLLFKNKEKYKGLPIEKAINYTLNNWEQLIVFIEHGEIEIDNNIAENSLRTYVVGRKNYLFTHSSKGAEIMANLYTVVMSARANEIDVVRYFSHLLIKLEEYNKKMAIDNLLPWSKEMKERFGKK